MPNIPSKYPNFAAEMSRKQLDYKPLYEEIAEKFKRSKDTVSNWFTGRAGELPTTIAFYIRDEYFPEFTVDYLFSETPIYPDKQSKWVRMTDEDREHVLAQAVP